MFRKLIASAFVTGVIVLGAATAAGAVGPPVHCRQQINYCTNPRGCGPFHYNWQTGKFVPAVPFGGYLWTETICTKA